MLRLACFFLFVTYDLDLREDDLSQNGKQDSKQIVVRCHGAFVGLSRNRELSRVVMYGKDQEWGEGDHEVKKYAVSGIFCDHWSKVGQGSSTAVQHAR